MLEPGSPYKPQGIVHACIPEGSRFLEVSSETETTHHPQHRSPLGSLAWSLSHIP